MVVEPASGGLKVLAKSPAFVENAVAMHVNHKKYQAELVRDVTGLQDNPEGKQILLFKSQHSTMIESQDLDNVVELRSKYFKLAGTMARKVPTLLAITFNNGLSSAPKGR